MYNCNYNQDGMYQKEGVGNISKIENYSHLKRTINILSINTFIIFVTCLTIIFIVLNVGNIFNTSNLVNDIFRTLLVIDYTDFEGWVELVGVMVIALVLLGYVLLVASAALTIWFIGFAVHIIAIAVNKRTNNNKLMALNILLAVEIIYDIILSIVGILVSINTYPIYIIISIVILLISVIAVLSMLYSNNN